MSDGEKETPPTGNHYGLLVKFSDVPDVPDWPARIAKMKGAAERMQRAIDDFADATKNTRWTIDGEDIARQLQDLVERGHEGNSVLDLTHDIEVFEEIPCQKSKSTSRKVR